jgi:hypothetical protein
MLLAHRDPGALPDGFTVTGFGPHHKERKAKRWTEKTRASYCEQDDRVVLCLPFKDL